MAETFLEKFSTYFLVRGRSALTAGETVMPRKPSTVVVMKGYQPFSSRRWVRVKVAEAGRTGREALQLTFSVEEEPNQAGRTIVHSLPALLAPGSPLGRFLANGFGICLTENEPFDLTTLVGRTIEAKFSKAEDGEAQVIIAVRPFSSSVNPPEAEAAAVVERRE